MRQPGNTIGIILTICLLTVTQSAAFTQTPEIDSLLKVTRSAAADTTRISAYIDVIGLVMEAHPEQGIAYGFTALAMARKINDSAKQGACLQSIGVCYDYKGNLDSCLHYLNAAYAIHRAMNRPDRQSHVISDIAIAWYLRGNYELALRNYLQALELRKQYGDKNYISKSLNNIGLLYKARKDYANAIRYYQQSIAIKEELKDERGLVATYMNIGSMFQSQKQYDSAYIYAVKCQALAKKLHLTDDIGGATGNIGEAMFSLKRYAESEAAYLEAKKFAIQSDCRSCMVNVLHGLGNIYIYKKDFSHAIQSFNEGLQLSRSNKRAQYLIAFYGDLSFCYREMGNYRMALLYQDSANTVSNETLNEENLRQVNELTTIYETAEKEKRIGILNAERDVSIAEAGRRKRERNYFFLSTILFLALAVVAWRAYTSNKKKKELLNSQNKIIEQSLQDKEILLKEIHHRVKNNLQLVSSLLSLQTDYIKDELALDAVKESRNRVHSMALIHQNLYQEDNLTGIHVQEYIGKLCDNLFHSYNVRPGKVQLIKEIQPCTWMWKLWFHWG